MHRKEILISTLFTTTGALAGTFIFYCEKMQFPPFTIKGRIARLILAAMIFGFLFGNLILILRKAILSVKRKQWLPYLMITLTISVCIMIWFPIPETGLYSEHKLTIRPVIDENEGFKPVTLTWLHRGGLDIPLSTVTCSGNCSSAKEGLTICDENTELTWHGITGKIMTIEFISDENQGSAEINWDGKKDFKALNNTDLNRLSFDYVFTPSNGLPEFIAVWWLCFLLAFTFVLISAKYLPRWKTKYFGAGIFICFALFRAIQFLTVSEPLFFYDSKSYLGMAQMSVSEILSGTKYCHEGIWYCISRPAFIPLVYKLCQLNPQTITIVQLIVSILSWGFFAEKAAALCRTDLRKKTAFLLTFGLGCVPNVTRWDQMIMSESLSISSALLLMGSCFWLIKPNIQRSWQPLPALFTALSAFLYAQSRDSAVWIVILITLLLLAINNKRTERKWVLILCAFLTGTSIITMSGTDNRWQFPFENVLFNRIARDPQAEKFFTDAGMPNSGRIPELYGQEHMMGSELFNSDEAAPLREWIIKNGLKTYIRYLIQTPVKTLKLAWNSGFEKEAFEQIDYTFTPAGFRQILPDPVIKFFSCNLPAIIITGFALAGLYFAFLYPDGERFTFPILFILSSYILCTGVILADEYEFARHSMVILIMQKAASWPLICMLSEESAFTKNQAHTFEK